jgi:uncharacterized protein (TIGR03435 family)
MNAIRLLSSQPWVARLGWTLVHFLWEGMLISALYAAARRWIAGKSRPNGRYILACMALAAMTVAPLATFSLLRPSETIAVSTHLAGGIPSATSAAVSTLTTSVPGSVRATVPDVRTVQALSWVVVIWMAGAMAFWVRLMGGWMVAARMRSMLVRPAPPEWQQALCHLQARIRVSRPVRLLVSALVQVPTVVGWLRPVVLVPVGALAGLSPEHVEAFLLHELAHIRRHDYLVNILQSVAEALLFYHPAVWWVSGHIRAERELCCDDIAVSASGGDVLTYACALAELESSRLAHFEAVIAANGGSLADRIARLLGQARPVSRTPSGLGAIAVAALLVVTACVVFGQSDPAPKFEVASIKLNTDRSIRYMRVNPRPGGLVTENAPLRLLIQNAYSVQEFQISGGPGWMQSDGYNIDAKGDGKANRDQVFLMLRALLEDRFQLKIHGETKELPVYALTVAKNGPKLPQPKEGGCVAIDPNAPPPPLRPVPGPGRSPVFPCGRAGVMAESSGARMHGGKVPMAEFIRTLSMIMGRPVIDKTGFAEPFDLTLDFTPDEATAGLPRGGGPRDAGSPVPAADPAAPPSIFAAIQEQLGLKLESTKGPVEVLVIDHVERPTEN